MAALGAVLPTSGWSASAFQSAAVQAQGYGTDPDLIAPAPVPWPMILKSEQLQTLATISEVLCPGAVDAGVSDVLNEWLSAPYEDQLQDRKLILPGLDWMAKEDDLPARTIELATKADQRVQGRGIRFMDRLRSLLLRNTHPMQASVIS